MQSSLASERSEAIRTAASRFVRTLVVIFLAKAVQRALLIAAIGPRMARHFGRHGAMHAFMASVLFRMSRLNALRNDAEFDQEHRQPAQAGDASGSERRAVVGAHRQRH